ncbi:unnamed protein product [Pleuronectes platessa]|uniref:Uncharacterized protein n=1 Tax=Pleuronectes platessa TaxID=8262 RepID=A0A9N7YV44_PLEPL|nr:unnamed protein product [Pleuronectes platessa]
MRNCEKLVTKFCVEQTEQLQVDESETSRDSQQIHQFPADPPVPSRSTSSQQIHQFPADPPVPSRSTSSQQIHQFPGWDLSCTGSSPGGKITDIRRVNKDRKEEEEEEEEKSRGWMKGVQRWRREEGQRRRRKEARGRI